MTGKEQYAAFCKRHPEMPVMMQPWWMDAVCAGKQWDVLLFTRSEIQNTTSPSDEAPDEVLAVMPYLIRRRMGYTFVVMPQMTAFGGVWMTQELQASPDMQERLAKLIVSRLKSMRIAYFYQQFCVGNPMPHWLAKRGMKVERRVTYCIDDLSDIEDVEGAYSKNKKRQLLKAEDLEVDMDMSAEEFYKFHSACMVERGKKLSYSREFLLVLERKARRAGQCAILRISGQPSTVTGQQSPVTERHTLAAAFVVWDKRYLYYLIPAYLPSEAKSGASARLADEAIRLAKSKGLQFDFEGGNDDEGIANHYKQFGSHAVNYQSVSKVYRPSFRILLKLNSLREKRLFK